MSGQTLFAKLWEDHQVASVAGDRAVMVIDRLMLHEITGGYALREMMRRGERPLLHPSQVFAVADHAISTAPDRGPFDSPSKGGSEMIASLAAGAQTFGFDYASPNSLAHGIVHVAAPEQGFVMPGMTLVCGDSHTCTNGAFGALAFAAGSGEIASVLRYGALIVQKAKTLRVTLNGRLGERVYSKDIALGLLAKYGVRLALGYAIEFFGEAVDALSIEGRMTLCNMAAEMGTRYALIAPDNTTYDYLAAHSRLDDDALRASAVHWPRLHSDDDARFDKEITFHADTLTPQVTWGTSPMHAVSLCDKVPEPDVGDDPVAAQMARRALEYMALKPGTAMQSIPIDAAFIGSCTNARLSDLRAAAEILRGRKIAPGVQAMCTPGSMAVRAAAEAEGLHLIFEDAGFSWRKSGCSNCAGREGPIWQGKRVISSTNRNFENRQGSGTRTHLASPATVAASAVTGYLTDPREL
ncbi:3-isopropylmalate dehydratase large subunit [Serratia entomophila]|uniref:3-isopropylmalate dehydratase n=1 Tax=Serratia entomophila TaxID=42906 RepID=A0ABY5D104_9GAMM|nr:3-isopropylmalate dehydratase large subunit [Serratia entomophila]UIW20585.1 3-isopropylmalate dehydratase large subunit [Serratia entomophila]USV03092.1 3-isopropylmalate dehydratase large subunit [Serratia entomophila]CAI0720685.1 3-isopropylmalate dehydratase large subunit [Serratia entomophila]CAI0803858.1 3-isopropylmalate dehydratase large subunit [Serratia entomophila]CAI0811632.1 3-isopropylmalate dehydratase large subunit [Serratia entomophila]